MKHTTSIKKNHLFRRLYHKGNSAVSPFFAVYTMKEKQGNGRKKSWKPSHNKQAQKPKNMVPSPPQNKIGITVSTKLGNAVKRNRIRRRISEIYRTHEEEFVLGHMIVIVARGRCATASYQQMERSLLKLMEQLSLCVPAGKKSGDGE